MLKLLIVLFIATIVHCQNSDLLTRPFYNSRYDQYDIDQDAISLRRPIKRYQYEDDDVVEDEPYTTQQKSTPSHKDYEQILKRTHLARLRLGTKKQNLPPQQNPQPTAEQYLKEVNPTTSTVYNNNNNNRQVNYSRFIAKQEDRRSSSAKFAPYRYVAHQDQQQKDYLQYQYEEEAAKQISVKPTPFNIVAYQNALLAQQKVLAAAASIEQQSSTRPQMPRIQKTKQKPAPIPKEPPQYEYYQQRRQQIDEQPRYQIPIIDSDDFLDKSSDYEPIQPTRSKINKNSDNTRKQQRYQVDEQTDDYPITQKYQIDDQYVDYAQQGENVANTRQQSPQQRYQSQRRQVIPRSQLKFKYESNDDHHNSDYVQYQQPEIKRKLSPQYRQVNTNVRQNRYLQQGRQFLDEMPNLSQQYTDLSYQQSIDIPVVYRTIRQDCDQSRYFTDH